MREASAERAGTGRPVLPYTYIAARLLIIAPSLLIIAFIVGGFAGWGPGHHLIHLTHHALRWVDSVTGLHWR